MNDLDAVLSPEGWPYATSGTGRFHCLFGLAYYGTADATGWFLVLKGALGEWDDPARRAAAWLADALDAGDGLVRHAPGALQNSWDGRATRT